MKKSALLALACAALVSSSAFAQSTKEVTYVEDPSQGYTFNRFKDNWFISAEGGVNFQFSKTDAALKWSDRFAPSFGIEVGKWFSPIIGTRIGITYMGCKGVSNGTDAYGLVYDENGNIKYHDQYAKTKVFNLGVNIDGILNITNWWCGYKPNRVYNFMVYGGGVVYGGMHQDTNGDIDSHFDTSLALRAGIINSFNVSKQVAIALDLRYTAITASKEGNIPFNSISQDASALLSVTYLFNNRTWTAPIVPVCPVVEDCDPIRARLAEAEARLADTQRKLDECLRRPTAAPVEAAACDAPLATVYFPVGSATVSSIDRKVLSSVASQINANSNTTYDVCGWADNYSGSDAVNQRLREKRANNVKNVLVNAGANESQLNVTTNSGNRFDGKENINLDRCVTIQSK